MIKDATWIRERPAEAEDRAVPSHWEGDLLAGSGNTHVATLVERRSRYTILVKVKSKDTATVVKALQRRVRTLPSRLRRPLTWDRGMEMASQSNFAVAMGVTVYFCYPTSPWQRGTNGLLRQYMPRGMNLSRFSRKTLDRIAKRLNGRPRQTLGFDTPASIIHQALR